MKHSEKNLAALFLCLGVSTTALAQSTLNIVGYINVVLQPGDNLVANQLLQQVTDNTLNNCLVGGVLAGTTFTQWDPVHNQFLPLSMFNGHTWSINYNWNPVDGMGGVINSPSLATNTFVGEVYQNASHPVGDPLFGFWDGTLRSPGVYLLQDQDPIQASFTMVVGRDPLDGESVRTLNALTQTYSLTTFHQGVGWDNGVPSLAVGQSAYFTLVPEPSTLALAALGLALMIRPRRCK
jgi:hypothetical protein